MDRFAPEAERLQQVINEIQDIRTQNNKNWMDLLRLAVRHAPDEVKQIMKKITNCDQKINELMRRMST